MKFIIRDYDCFTNSHHRSNLEDFSTGLFHCIEINSLYEMLQLVDDKPGMRIFPKDDQYPVYNIDMKSF